MVFNMLYPKLSNVKRNNIIFIASIAISVIIINILLIINVLVDKTNHWSMLCIAGIIYAYGTVIYTKKRNVNIASNVFAQCLLVSLLILAIDYFLGYRGWSINIAIPIVVIVANSTLMILTIISRKRYIRYAVYHMLTFLFSMIPLILLLSGILENKVLTIVSSGIAGLSLLLTIILCGKAMWEETKKRLHV
jgi:hypothetical protein